MLIKEFRIAMPFSTEEYEVGNRYTIAEISRNETGGGEGVQILKDEMFTNLTLNGRLYASGQYTYKKYHIASQFPGFIRLLAPKSILEVEEESWNAYPYCLTIITNPAYMKDCFKITIETLHLPDKGDTENALDLPEKLLKQREVVHIDICDALSNSSEYNIHQDPTKFKSKKYKYGPLSRKWTDKCAPVMTCYKVVTCEFKWFGIQGRVETFIQKMEHRVFTSFHRQMYCWLDNWYGLTLTDIRSYEFKIKAELDQRINNDEVKHLL